jgi:hypothetical protein
MKKMTIHFKNGKTKTVHYSIATAIQKRIETGCKQWLTFTEASDMSLTLVLNLDEVTHID